MIEFLLKRLLVILVVVSIANATGFLTTDARSHELLLRLPPGSVSDEAVNKKLPDLIRDYGDYLQAILQGRASILRNGSGSGRQLIVEALPNSLTLLALSLSLAAAIGIGVGLLSVNVNAHRTNQLALMVALGGFAMPSFYLGIVILGTMLWVSFSLRQTGILLPISGYGLDEHLILPVLVLASRPTAEIARITAELTAGELSKEYIRAARAKGLPWRLVVLRHAFRNIIAVVITTLSNGMRYLISSLIVVEWLFLWPGVGYLLVQALLKYSGVLLEPVVVAEIMSVIALLLMLISLGADLIGQLVDIRLRPYNYSAIGE